jgi:lipoate-protein ligase A
MFTLLKLKSASCTQAADIAKRKITSIESELGHAVTPDEVAHALAKGFESVLNVDLKPGELTPYELEHANILCREKYATEEWNFKGKAR